MILAFGKGDWVQLSYMVAALLFVFGIKQLSRVKTARKGNQMAASAMLLATVATMVLLWGQVVLWIIVAGVVVGGVAGYLLATKTPMTAMPELVAVFNGMGGAASMFVALSEVSSFTDSYSSHALHEVEDLGGGAAELNRGGIVIGHASLVVAGESAVQFFGETSGEARRGGRGILVGAVGAGTVGR